MTPVISTLQPQDQAEWEPLARGYKAFYREDPADEAYRRTWVRLMAAEEIFGLGARVDGRLVGIAHYLFHPTVWLDQACYLQDLFTAPEARGRGVARALIEAVAEAARSRGASRYYWLTAEDNATARALYDQVAHYKGFIRYEYPVLMTERKPMISKPEQNRPTRSSGIARARSHRRLASASRPAGNAR